MVKKPLFTLILVTTIALGVGANTAVFTVVRSVLLKPLSYSQPEQLVALFEHETASADVHSPTSPASFLYLKDHSRSLTEMTAAHPWTGSLEADGHPELIPGLKATPHLFQLLGVRPLLGTTFDVNSQDEHVVVLGFGLWKRLFAGDRGVIGRTVQLNGEGYVIQGIMPEGFGFPPFWAADAEFWVPLILTPEDRMRQSRMLRVFARLRPGFSVEEARSDAGALWTRLQEQFPTNRGSRPRVESLKEPVVGASRRILLVLMAAVGLLLLIACANVANLLLSRSSHRSYEFAVRTALGAGRGRIASQLLTESLVISVIGAAVGLVLGVWGLDAVLAVSQKVLPRSEEIHPDRAVVLFSLAIAIASGLLFSLPPILTSFRSNLVQPLREGERQSPHRSRSRLGSVLVVAQVCLALVLLVGAGLLSRSFWNQVRLDPGFATDNVLTMKVSFAGTPFADADRQGEFLKTLQDQVTSLPGVETAALANHLPIGGDIWQARFLTRQTAAVSDEDMPRAVTRTVSPGFLKAAGIGLVSGRDFDAADIAGGRPVVVVNERLAELYFPGQNVLGQTIRVGRGNEDRWSEIVGVVKNYRQWALTDEVRPEIISVYSPYAVSQQSWFTSTSLIIRSQTDVQTLSGAIQKSIWDINPKLAIAEIRTVDDILSAQRADSGFYLAFLALFAGTALVLSLVGIFGLISYLVSERTREIAVRAALGAGRTEILGMVLRRGVFLALSGIALGIPMAASLVHVLEPVLYQVPQFEPWVFVSASALFLIVATAASYVPARRALRIDPAEVLRG